jgi:type II secretory pathway component GspD/PulD (secretin)
MKLPNRSLLGLAAAVACPVLAALFIWSPTLAVHGVDSPAGADSTNAPKADVKSTNAAPASTNAAVAPSDATVKSTNAPEGASSTNAVASTNALGTNAVAGKDGTSTNEPPKDEVQLSFQGANVDMVAQWLAQTTGKSVVKHPRVQCQLTIMGGKKLTMREALNIVYRALAVEGNTVTETSKSIIITPEGSELKISPELVTTNVPEGRQKLVKVFNLQHAQAADLRDRLKGLLAEKAQIDIDEKANRIMITDFTDNITLASDLVAVLDTDNPADVTLRMIPIKHVNAQNLAREIQPLYQKARDKNPKEIVEISANDRSNSLLILSSDTNYRAIERIVESLDTSDAKEKIMQAFPLKNADAQDVAKQLKDLYAAQDDSGSVGGYRIIYFGGGGGNGNEDTSKKVNFVADNRRNAVIVQATAAAIPTIADMIKTLDEPITDDSLAPKIYHLKYVGAADIEDILNELFLKKKQQRSYWDYYDDMENGGSTPDA